MAEAGHPIDTNSSAAIHNAQSLLLKMPQEIKNQIYEYVCGGQMIHIHGPQDYDDYEDSIAKQRLQLHHHLCLAAITPEAAQNAFTNSKAIWFVEANKYPHEICCDWPHHHAALPDSDVLDRTGMKLNLGFLRASRQIHEEASILPYTKNTFSFDDGSILRTFMVQFNENMPHIRAIRVQIERRYSRIGGPWMKTLIQAASNFKSLKQLHVSLYFESEQDCHFVVPPDKENRLVIGLKAFASLGLRSVTVVVSDVEGCGGYAGAEQYASSVNEGTGRWTIGQKQEWAGHMRNLLLGHDQRASLQGGGEGHQREDDKA